MKGNLTMMLTILITLLSAVVGCNETELEKPNMEPDPVCGELFPPLDTVILTHSTFAKGHYPERIKIFQNDTIAEDDIVMLGNSLTEQGGSWGTKLDVENVKNRGIAGDNTDGVMARLNEVICRKPSVVFIMIGTNDLFTGYKPSKISQNIDSIGTLLSFKIPEAKIIVQTIMPLGSGHDKKSKLLEINRLLSSFMDREYELLDTYQHMANEAGDLPEEYTYDGVHLTPAGYAHWSTLLKANIN